MIDRRTFGQAVGTGTAAVSLGGLRGVPAAPTAGQGGASPSGPAGSFPRLRRIRAGLLDVGCAESGPAHGPVVVCLHGWPYDIHSYAGAAPLLAARGYRVIVPYLRGHGITRFLSDRTVRNAQQSVVALDIVALMDALKIEQAVLAGFDWGSRTADVIAALWPGRCRDLVSVSGYLVTDRKANLEPLPARTEHTWWYQFYFATERGRKAMEDRDRRRDLTRLVWTQASPTWDFDDATFDRTAAAFDNPDYAAVVVHNYRRRLGLAPGERRYDGLEKQLAARPVIGVPTVTLDPGRDPFTAPGGGSAYRDSQDAPEAFAQAVVDADRPAAPSPS
ncbi:alpha/beta fold hydrolase [Streptomyces sp. NPDC001068]|uniref:alpha/beta fold hydrolase n=1 Tax=Streptomyces sp. NPDC001068 TaxID=3364544 RepID=UPI0036B0D984